MDPERDRKRHKNDMDEEPKVLDIPKDIA